jgi:ABC-type phosphonate transport system ATPase subunit
MESYKRQANEAFRMAEAAGSDLERIAWLLVAEGWLTLLRQQASAGGDDAEATREPCTTPGTWSLH